MNLSDGLGIELQSAIPNSGKPPAYATATSPKLGQARWTTSSSKRPHYAHHRRVSTAAIIALASKSTLTPSKVLGLFAIVASASYLARALPLLWHVESTSVYNPAVVYHPAEIYEAMRPIQNTLSTTRKSKKPKSDRFLSQQKARGAGAGTNQKAQSVHQAKAANKFLDFFDQVDPKSWKGKKGDLDVVAYDGVQRSYEELNRVSKVVGDEEDDTFQLESALSIAKSSVEEEDYIMEDNTITEDLEAEILDEEEDATYDPRAYSYAESENWDDAVHLDESERLPKVNLLPLPLRGSRRAPKSNSDQSIAGLAAIAAGRERAKLERQIVPTRTQEVEAKHTEKTTIFEDPEDAGEMMDEILMKQ